MQLVVRAYPVLPGHEDRARQVAREMQTTRSSAARDFYRRHGVARETWHTQITPHGMLIMCVTQLPEKAVELAAKDYATSQEPFDRWLKDQVRHLTGIDPDVAPLGPATACVFDSGDCLERGPAE